MEFDEFDRIPKESCKKYIKWLDFHSTTTKSGKLKRDYEAKELSKKWVAYLALPRQRKRAIQYIIQHKELEEQYLRQKQFHKPLSLKYLKKALRILRVPVSYTNKRCLNCGNIESQRKYESKDVHEPLYAEKRAYEIKSYLRSVIHYYRQIEELYLRFLTLTIKRIPTKEFDKDVLKHLKSLFKKFYDRKFFRNAVKGYCAVLEIKHYSIGDIQEYKDHKSGKIIKKEITQENEGYHPHLHILLLGDKSGYIPSKDISRNWEEVCSKTKGDKAFLFQGSKISNIKTPETLLKFGTQQFKNSYSKDLSDKDKADVLINYLTSYVTKQSESIKANEYDFETDPRSDSVKNCPYLRYFRATERIDFVSYGGILKKSNSKELVLDKEKKYTKKQIEQKAEELQVSKESISKTYLHKAIIPQKIKKEELRLKEKFSNEIPKDEILHLKALKYHNSQILQCFDPLKSQLECDLCGGTDWRTHSVGDIFEKTKDFEVQCLIRAINNI